MLIRFAVENHLSIRDQQELSLVASSLKDKGADLISVDREYKLLPAALIYGANASGKTNLVSAIGYFRGAVTDSHSRREPDQKIPRLPFALDEKSSRKPTKFEIDFLINKTRYHYGFLVSDDEFLKEWLFAFPSGKKQTWFVREKRRKKIYFGNKLRGQLKTIESLMRPNSLFLSAAAQNSHKQLTPLYRYIAGISIHFPNTSEESAKATFGHGKIDKRIIEFLLAADTGIVGYQFNDFNRDEKTSALMAEIFQVMEKHVPGGKIPKLEDLKLKVISLGHKTKTKKDKYLDLNLESRGTIRLLMLLKSIYTALDRGSVVVIDELDSSLHTYLSEKIVSLFNFRKTNPKGAQLIATTHDTNLLAWRQIRRDQIWFAEKDNSGATTFYPLTDIRTRNTDNLEKGYLQGRFGAVPFRGVVRRLMDAS